MWFNSACVLSEGKNQWRGKGTGLEQPVYHTWTKDLLLFCTALHSCHALEAVSLLRESCAQERGTSPMVAGCDPITAVWSIKVNMPVTINTEIHFANDQPSSLSKDKSVHRTLQECHSIAFRGKYTEEPRLLVPGNKPCLHGLVTSINTMKYGKYIWDYVRHWAIWEDWSTVEIQHGLTKAA